jgi:hypothetical protein
MKSQSFRLISLMLAFVLTIGVAGLASAQQAEIASGSRIALQATEEPTPIDIDTPIVLTLGKSETTPLDNEAVGYRNFGFAGKANQVVTVSVQQLTGNLSFYVSLLDQSDDELANASGKFLQLVTLTVKLPQDGNYRIRVDQRDPGAGDFAAGSVSVTVNEGMLGAATPAATAAIK